jgi:serine/threonine protein kinase/WD40 repeat protein
MGVVYEAEQISLGRCVALKVLPFAAVLDARHLQRFQNEVRAAATLDHPHIVSVYFVGEDRGVHFYAMQLIEGPSLADVISELREPAPPAPEDSRRPEGTTGTSARRRCATAESTESGVGLATLMASGSRAYFRQAVAWAIQVARALEHAHSLGIVHRDIKPSNLLLDARRTLWVADFGLALTPGDSSLTMTGDLLGTLRYMSPEQARGDRKALDHRTDVYSLGVTLFELLALRAAFPVSDRQQLLEAIIAGEAPALRSVRNDVPVDLDTIVAKAVAKDPSRRYATAAELAADLERYLSGHPIAARRSSTTERAVKWVRRHPARATLAAVVALAAIAVPAALALHIQQLQEVNEELLKQTNEATINAKLYEKSAEEAKLSAALATVSGRDSRVRAYLAQVGLAAQYVSDGNPHPAERLLEHWLPEHNRGEDLRGFEWSVLWNQRAQQIAAGEFSGAVTASYCLAPFSWDSTHRSLAYTNANLRVASLRGNGAIDDHILRKSGAPTNGLAWIHNGDDDQLAVAGQAGVEIWDVRTGKLLRKLPTTDEVVALGVSPSHHYLVWYGSRRKELHVCRWPEGDERVMLPVPIGNHRLAFCREQNSERVYFAYSLDYGPFIGWLDLDTSECRRLIRAEQPLRTFAVSPRGDTLATGGLGIDLYSLPSGRHRMHIAAHDGDVLGLDFRFDGRLASCGNDGVLRWWDTCNGREMGHLHWQQRPTARVRWSDDGDTLLAATEDAKLVHWQIPTDTSRLRPSGSARGPIAVSSDARTVAFGDEQHRVWLVDGELRSVPRELDREPWPVADVQFSSDRSRLAVLDDRRASLWEVDSGDCFWSGDVGAGTCVRFSQDGERLAFGRADGDVLLVSLANELPETHKLGREGPAVSDVALLSNHDCVVVAGGLPELTIHPLTGGDVIRIPSPRAAPIRRLSIVPDGTHLIAQDADGVEFELDCTLAPDFQPLRMRDISDTDAAQTIRVLSNGRELAMNGGAQIVDLTNATETWRFNSDMAIRAAACSADGRFIFTTTQGFDLVRWDRASFSTRRLPQWGLRPVYNLAFGGAGSRLLAGTLSRPTARTRENNVQPLLRPFKNVNPPLRTDGVPWERTADSLRSWNLEDRVELAPVADIETRVPHHFVEASDAADRVVTGSQDGSVWIWEQSTGRHLNRLHVSLKAEKGCKLVELASRVVHVVPNYGVHGEILTALAVSRDRTRVAAFGHCGGMRVWQLFDGQQVCSAVHDLGSAFLGWTAGDRWLVTSAMERVRLVDPRTGEVGSLGGRASASRIATGVVSPDGRLAATAHDDRTIQIWALDNETEPKEIAALPGHLGSALSLAFTNDGRRLVSGSSDGAIKFWSLETFEEVAHIAKFRGAVRALRFSPDGRYLAAGGEDETGHGEIHLWDGGFLSARDE